MSNMLRNRNVQRTGGALSLLAAGLALNACSAQQSIPEPTVSASPSVVLLDGFKPWSDSMRLSDFKGNFDALGEDPGYPKYIYKAGKLTILLSASETDASRKFGIGTLPDNPEKIEISCLDKKVVTETEDNPLTQNPQTVPYICADNKIARNENVMALAYDISVVSGNPG